MENELIKNIEISDEEIAQWSNTFAEEAQKTSEEILRETIHLLHHLNEIELRLSEHRAVEAYNARFGSSEIRRKKLMGERSSLRFDIHDFLNRLQKEGMSEEEMYEKLPFLSEHEIKRLLANEP